ncbi:MAG: DUF1778 domain-containing protein [Actinomycetota bacterium]
MAHERTLPDDRPQLRAHTARDRKRFGRSGAFPGEHARQAYASATRTQEAEAVSVSAFVVGAATQKAQEILGHKRVTAIPAELFDRLVASLDDPDPAPGLATAVKRARKQPRIA